VEAGQLSCQWYVVADLALVGGRVLIAHEVWRCVPAVAWKHYEDWELDNAAGKSVAEIRPVRGEIRRRSSTCWIGSAIK